MKTIRNFIALFVAIISLAACTKEKDEDKSVQETSISSDDFAFTAGSGGGVIYFSEEGGAVTLNVDCAGGWVYENDSPDFFSTSATDNTLTISAGQNTLENDLEGVVTLYTAAGNVLFATVTVKQGAHTSYEIGVESNEWHAPAVGELTVSIKVESALGAWTVENTADWLEVESSEDAVTLTAGENKTYETRETKVWLTADNGIRTASVSIAVIQDGSAYINFSLKNNELTFMGSGGSKSIPIESNFDWEFECDCDWADLSKTDDGSLLAVVDENNGGGVRECTIYLTAGDGRENTAESLITLTQSEKSEPLVMTFTTTSSGDRVVLPLSGTVNCVVDWGDGSEYEVFSDAFPIHTYGSAGDYTVTVEGEVTELCSEDIATDTSKYLTGVLSWGETGLVNMDHAFYKNENLALLPDSAGDALAGVVSFNNAFYNCKSLVSHPSFAGCVSAVDFTDAFRGCSSLEVAPTFENCSAVNTFENVFYGCTAMTQVPQTTFSGCTAAQNFKYAFYNCNVLESVPESLFSGLESASAFDNAFERCYSLTAAPKFSNLPSAESLSRAFYDCKGLTEVPEGMFSGCAAKNFSYIFRGCTSLESVPETLFCNLSNAENVSYAFFRCSALVSAPRFADCPSLKLCSYVFYTCPALVTVPEGMFSNSPAVTTFQSIFADCTSLESVPAGIFADHTDATALGYIFSGCTALSEIPSGLFSGCTGATGFSHTFYGCTALSEIPSGLFSDCTLATDFSYTFDGCTLLGAVPTGLFSNCMNATSFNYVFNGCTGIVSVPEDLFCGFDTVSEFLNTFAGCTNLTSAPKFTGCSKAVYFTYVFSGCTSLYSIPEGMFSGCTGAMSYASTFMGCSSLNAVPTSLFDDSMMVINFLNCFNGCSSVQGESPYTEIEVDGETVKVHLYERGDYKAVLGCETPTNHTTCFTGSSFSDMPLIPAEWGGDGD